MRRCKLITARGTLLYAVHPLFTSYRSLQVFPYLLMLTSVRLAPEVAHVRPWWSWVGGGAGMTIGYIVANIPGAVAGGMCASSPGLHTDCLQ